MTAIAATAPTTIRPGKVRNRVLWSLQIVLGLFFILVSGLPKLLNMVPEQNTVAMREAGLGSPWLMYFIGVCEIAGGIGLLVRYLSGPAAAGLSVLTLLAAATNVFLTDMPAYAPFPLALSAIFAWIAYERRDTITGLRSLRTR
ncbi:DoxX family protein [Nocardia brasiliensis]|uniref:DoxX family protein n=1 Tax=Nocardia brasiliensis TaxID=37326 RepID=UPI001892E00F|nr:DoxX family protein [Nocardia brasiliensis]MBF6128158.1 DoxX family protein [Nocardia brasiliensis]